MDILTKVSCDSGRLRSSSVTRVNVLTGHFNDIVCGPATISSSSVIAWITAGLGLVKAILYVLIELTFLLDFTSSSKMLSFQAHN